MENDIANGSEDVEQEHYPDDEEEEKPEVRPKGKKVKLPEETKPIPWTETQSRGKKENECQFFIHNIQHANQVFASLSQRTDSTFHFPCGKAFVYTTGLLSKVVELWQLSQLYSFAKVAKVAQS